MTFELFSSLETYFPRTNVPKSERLYSRRNVSAEPPLAFFIDFPLGPRCFAGADNSDYFSPFRCGATPSGLAVVGGEAALAASIVALGAAGAWFVHADRGHEVKWIDLIAGARPNFIKIAPIIDALKSAQAQGKNVFV